MSKALKSNIKNIYWMSFFQSGMIVTAVFVPLLQRHGLSMAEVLQTQALFAFAIAGLEVPSGYLADLWGRRHTIMLGQALCALAFLQLLVSDGYWDFMCYEALMGAGLSLCSGADLALLYDSQTVLNERGEAPVPPGKHIARLVAIEGYAGAAAAMLASLLSFWDLDWVLWAQVAVGLAAFGLSLRLVEAPRQISVAGHGENFQRVATTLGRNPLVAWTALAIILFGLASLFAFWLTQKYWEQQGVPLHWFGWIWAGHCLLRAGAAHCAEDLERRLGWRRLLALSALLPALGFLGMGLGSGITGVLFGLAFPLCRGISLVMFYDALNKRVDADFRATINSLVSLGMRAVFIFTGPLLGYLADARGINASLLALAALFVPAVALVLIPLARHIKREEGGGSGGMVPSDTRATSS